MSPQTIIREPSGRLHIEPGDDLLFRTPKVKGDFKSFLIGMQLGEFLCLRMPPVPSADSRLAVNQTAVIRYLHDGAVYGFKTKILHLMFEPFKLLFVSYPDEVERYDLRKSKRISCIIPCRIYHENGEFQAFIVDLSSGGCRINGQMETSAGLLNLEMGTEAVLDFTLCGQQENMMLNTVVVSSASDKKTVSLGLRYEEPDEETVQRIDSFIDSTKDLF